MCVSSLYQTCSTQSFIEALGGKEASYITVVGIHLWLSWTLSAMTSKIKNCGDIWETLYREPTERFTFRYDRHKETRGFSCKAYNTIIQCQCTSLLTFQIFIISDAISTNQYFICFTRDIHWFLHLGRKEILPL